MNDRDLVRVQNMDKLEAQANTILDYVTEAEIVEVMAMTPAGQLARVAKHRDHAEGMRYGDAGMLKPKATADERTSNGHAEVTFRQGPIGQTLNYAELHAMPECKGEVKVSERDVRRPVINTISPDHKALRRSARI